MTDLLASLHTDAWELYYWYDQNQKFAGSTDFTMYTEESKLTARCFLVTFKSCYSFGVSMYHWCFES